MNENMVCYTIAFTKMEALMIVGYPEIANYGALYAPFVCGLLGMHPTAKGLIFSIVGLEGLSELSTTLYFDQQPFQLQLTWLNGKWVLGLIQKRDLEGSVQFQLPIPSPRFRLARGDPWFVEPQ